MTYLPTMTDDELVRHLVQINPETDLERELAARFEILVDVAAVTKDLVLLLEKYNISTEDPQTMVSKLESTLIDAAEAEELRITIRELRNEVIDLENTVRDLRIQVWKLECRAA